MLKDPPPKKSRSHTIKRNTLLRTIHRKGSSSRLQLARELRISNSRVCDLIEEMIDQRLLQEQSPPAERRGRRGVNIRMNGSFGHFVGVDMEAKRLRLVVTDFSGEVVYQTRKPLHPQQDRQGLIDEIFRFIDDALIDIRPKFANILGIGLAASGVMDTKRGLILHYDLIPQAVNLPLRDLLAEHTRLPCVMENNIRAMTLAEWTAGAARGLHTFACVAVRSGVGAGIVLDGRLLRGTHGLCGEIGYMVLPTSASAASWKSFQQTVSESALGIDVESKSIELPEPVLRRTGELIGSQLASIAAVIDPQALILAGGMLDPNGPIWPHVIRSFNQLALAELVDHVKLLPAQLGPFAAAIGAAHRCLYELFPASVA